jgi:antitoxin Phd
VADGTWSAAEAKAKFSEVVEKAQHQGPQRITRHGKDAVVVVSAEAWASVTARSRAGFVEALLDPAARVLSVEEAETLFARDKDHGRPIDL